MEESVRNLKKTSGEGWLKATARRYKMLVIGVLSSGCLLNMNPGVSIFCLFHMDNNKVDNHSSRKVRHDEGVDTWG